MNRETRAGLFDLNSEIRRGGLFNFRFENENRGGGLFYFE